MIQKFGPLISQVVSSLGNFALLLVGSHRLSPSEFGKFSLVYAIVLFLSQITRAGVVESLMINGRFGRRDSSTDVAAATGAAVGLAFSAAAIVAGLSFALSRSVFFALACFGATICVILTDVTRYVCFGVSPVSAVKIDIVWTFVGLILAMSVGQLDAVRLLSIWALSAVAGAGLFFFRMQRAPVRPSVQRFIRSRSSRQLVFDVAVLSSSGILLLFVLGAVGGTDAVGEFRSAILPFTWMQIVLTGVYLSVARRTDAVELVSSNLVGWFVVFGVGAAFLSAIFIRTMPSHIGQVIFGKGWRSSQSLAVLVAIQYAAFWFAETMVAKLKITTRAQSLVKIRIGASLIVLACCLLLLKWPDPKVVSAGLAVGSLITGMGAFILSNTRTNAGLLGSIKGGSL
jgi:hypothetical protein